MSRSGYTEDSDNYWDLIRWRGAVKSAIRGRRGQSFLREMVTALDAMPEKKLIAHELESPLGGEFCALGVVGHRRGFDMLSETALDPEDTEAVAKAFGIAEALVKEIVYVNDEEYFSRSMDSEKQAKGRWKHVRNWAELNIRRPDTAWLSPEAIQELDDYLYGERDYDEDYYGLTWEDVC
jgi:hypothetical protein